MLKGGFILLHAMAVKKIESERVYLRLAFIMSLLSNYTPLLRWFKVCLFFGKQTFLVEWIDWTDINPTDEANTKKSI